MQFFSTYLFARKLKTASSIYLYNIKKFFS